MWPCFVPNFLNSHVYAFTYPYHSFSYKFKHICNLYLSKLSDRLYIIQMCIFPVLYILYRYSRSSIDSPSLFFRYHRDVLLASTTSSLSSFPITLTNIHHLRLPVSTSASHSSSPCSVTRHHQGEDVRGRGGHTFDVVSCR